MVFEIPNGRRSKVFVLMDTGRNREMARHGTKLKIIESQPVFVTAMWMDFIDAFLKE